MPDRQRRRLNRQFEAISRRFPLLKAPIAAIETRPGVLLRVPLAVLLMAGGLLGFLPVLGFWMLPLGLLILAIDLPLLRPGVSSLMIRGRRRWSLWWRRGGKDGGTGGNGER
ncbi:hypothetical protein [Pararhodobacter sp. SW119]|uniref:hypothetical protein n=1 Tax=Pararhodobacter sp. SW119 TaxID=2780075 RepID=UPI001AE0BA29|nr:hypothetical protein [Pararhodobacter sp. SW119]